MEKFAKLREPFPASQVGKLPKGGVTLDYVGHGAVTSRLLEVDPAWNWEPAALDERGLPLFELEDGYPVGLWIKLTVLELTRWGYGSVAKNTRDAEKQLIGDAIRNAAMRFGVALDLWVQGHAEDDEQRVETGGRRRQEPVVDRPISQENADKFIKAALSEGLVDPEIDVIVRKATHGRTHQVTEVMASEVPGLRDAFKWYTSLDDEGRNAELENVA